MIPVTNTGVFRPTPPLNSFCRTCEQFADCRGDCGGMRAVEGDPARPVCYEQANSRSGDCDTETGEMDVTADGGGLVSALHDELGGRAEAAHLAHNQEVAGSSPAPAIDAVTATDDAPEGCRVSPVSAAPDVCAVGPGMDAVPPYRILQADRVIDRSISSRDN